MKKIYSKFAAYFVKNLLCTRQKLKCSRFVVPAQAGIHADSSTMPQKWIPACARKTIDFFRNSTAEANCCVDSVLESSCTDVYTAVLRSESPCTLRSAASFERSLISFLSCTKKNLVFITLLFFNYLAHASIIANYSQQNVTLGETLQLTLTIDSATKGGAPNVMPLLKDFEVLSTERRYSFTNINGKTSSKSQWTILLKPKHAGTITIPALTIGKENSNPLTISVATASTKDDKTYNNNSTYTILKTKINEREPFINQQTLYTVKLYNRQQLFNGQYKAPEVENALIVPLGEGKSYQTTLKGEIYNVEEINYAIFPQKTGKISITPPEFTAEIIDGFNPTRIHLAAKPSSINVKPLSAKQDISDWLAAENVTISEEYDNPTTNYKAGDTIIRNITLKASGMVAQLLPKLTFTSNDNYNVYANKPHVENTLIDGKIIATATYKVTYLLTKAANAKIPAITVHWYNIDTKTNLTANLPAKTINVTANASKKINKIPQEIEISTEPQNKFQPIWLLAITGIILSLAVLVYYFRKSRNDNFTAKPKFSYIKKENLKIEFNPSLNIIQKACKANDPVATRQAILAFARQEWPELKILNLNNIPINDPEFKQEITKLTACLYAKDQNNTWDGAKLWQIFSKLKTKKPKNKTKKTLPPIYLH